MKDELLRKEIIKNSVLVWRDTEKKEAIIRRIDNYNLNKAKNIIGVAEILKDTGKNE